MTAICDAQLIYGRGGFDRYLFIGGAALRWHRCHDGQHCSTLTQESGQMFENVDI